MTATPFTNTLALAAAVDGTSSVAMRATRFTLVPGSDTPPSTAAVQSLAAA